MNFRNHYSEDNIPNNSNNKNMNCTKQAAKRGEDGWKEVVRKYGYLHFEFNYFLNIFFSSIEFYNAYA